MAQASKELLARVEDVWAFVSEPYNFSDWWPRIGGVRPDRRGFSEGARWTVIRGSEPGLLHRPNSPAMLLVQAVEPYRRFAFRLVGERLDVELELEPLGHDHTRATLSIHGPFRLGAPYKSRPGPILDRLYDLIQTAAALQD